MYHGRNNVKTGDIMDILFSLYIFQVFGVTCITFKFELKKNIKKSTLHWERGVIVFNLLTTTIKNEQLFVY